MKLTKQEIKKRYFDAVYNRAPMIPCACGCGTLIKSKDKYARDKKFVNGHNNRKYDDPTEYKRAWNHRNRSKRQAYKMQRLHAFKVELIINAGGKCVLCGLEFDGDCTAIFDFHHKNPKDKVFNINVGSLNKHNKPAVKKEAKKCELVCANCHRLIHWDWKAIVLKQ